MRINFLSFGGITVILLLFAGSISAQNVGIGTNTPDASAKLDLSDANRGLLLPRVSLVAVNNGTTPVSSPATGLLVWNTNAGITGGSGTGFYYWDGSLWQKLEPGTSVLGNDWLLTGNSGTNELVNFVGTLDGEDLAFRTNNTENMRININGNVGIGTQVNTARLYVNLPNTDNTTNYGIFNNYDGADNGTTYAMRNHNFGSSTAVKYGLYNEVNSDGTGGRYGIYNLTALNTASISASRGFYNRLDAYGSASNSSDHYGIQNQINTNGNGTTSGNIYGIWTNIDYDHPGDHYGNWMNLESNATYNSNNYANYNLLDGNGDGTLYGVYTDLASTGTGVKYGMLNTFADAQGTKYGVRNEILNNTLSGTTYGVYNYIYNNSNTSSKFGVYNNLSSNEGYLYGSYNYVSQLSTSTSSLYGVYGYASSTGLGTHYGGYFYGYGDGNYAVYGSNSHSTGWAGYYVGNFYADGNAIFNESGTSDHDFRIETDTRTHGFFSDSDENLVRFGTSYTGSDYQNGSTINSTVVDYVVDFDDDNITGTAIGIGSVEYLLDMSSETTINNRFSPSVDNTYDLGSPTLRWDDVYATNGTIVTSDLREKTQVSDLKYGLAQIMALHPVTYKWKNNLIGSTVMREDQKELKLGLIAQEVQKVVPEVVQTHDWRVTSEEHPDQYELVENERLGMSYHELIPVLIKGMQEQQAQIEALKKEIETLKAAK
ncbi:MAG: tail fiber domain-containing protein [Bacteroidia bacterium]|nr:tail fiber domain-containing protein [Bacteroidia bacterium]